MRLAFALICLFLVSSFQAFSQKKQEEIQEFLDSMTSEQFGKLSAFVETLPSLEKDLKVPCESCGETIERTLKGISDFLS